MTTGQRVGETLSRLRDRNLAAGRCRPPYRDQDVRPREQSGPDERREIAPDAMQARSVEIVMVPPCPSWPHVTMAFRILRPLTVVRSSSASYPWLPSSGSRNAFTLSRNVSRLVRVDCEQFARQSRCLPAVFWAKVSRPLFEESRLRSHFLNSVGEPGGGVESDNTMRRGCKIANRRKLRPFCGHNRYAACDRRHKCRINSLKEFCNCVTRLSESTRVIRLMFSRSARASVAQRTANSKPRHGHAQ